MAKGVLLVGLLLVGFGVLIIVMRDIFALLAAAVFFFIGIGCIGTAIKIYWAQRSVNRHMEGMNQEPFRENVRVRQTQIFEERF
jgi:hypothetical protein